MLDEVAENAVRRGTHGDVELDAADWSNIMILHIGFSLNWASKKVRYEPVLRGESINLPPH